MKITSKVESRDVRVGSQGGDGLWAESVFALVQAVHLPTRGSQVILVWHWGSHLHVISLQKEPQLTYTVRSSRQEKTSILTMKKHGIKKKKKSLMRGLLICECEMSTNMILSVPHF